MSKRVIPLLVTLMAISLIGIVLIQYNWIRQTVQEKEALIETNVQTAVENVEQQLNDDATMMLISSSVDAKELFESQLAGSNWETKKDTSTGIEIQVLFSKSDSLITADSINSLLFNNEIHGYDSNIHKSSSYQVMSLSEEENFLSLIERINLEIETSQENKEENRFRLDSATVIGKLKREFKANHLGEIKNWGIFDNLKELYTVNPMYKEEPEFLFPMFTTDIIEPRRYTLELTIDKDELLWADIWGMIVMSILFIVIITVVFAYSIRLVLKHKKISQIKSDFINNMTHEFKTPLASISLAADSLLHPNLKVDRSTLENYLGIIKSEKTKLNRQVERILEVASLRQDNLKIKIENVDLNEITRAAIDHLRFQIEEANVTIEFSSEGTCIANGNKLHLQNAIGNLIENAVKYRSENPKIRIEIEKGETVVFLRVVDNGIGMSQKQLNHAFDTFYRVQSGNIHSTKGFGLGLSYTKMVVEKMNGGIALKSKLHSGTTATLKLMTV